MSSACPSCFAQLTDDEARFRCNSGHCEQTMDSEGTKECGYPLYQFPSYRWVASEQQRQAPAWIPCRRCQGVCNVQVCPVCHRDLPQNWRQASVMTMAIAGARGSGKSVYIAVMLDALIKYSQRRSWSISPFTTGTRDTFERNYFEPLFQENRAIGGTPPIEGGGAYQRDPLIWHITGSRGDFYLAIRDVAGEDLQNASETSDGFGYLGRADLLVFLFDSLQLPSMRQILSGIIPEVDESKIGASSAQVLPKVLRFADSGHADLALSFSKFDAFHELPKADTEPYARIMGDPAAHFNRDDTNHRPSGPHAAQDAKNWFLTDVDFLDQEVRSLFQVIREDSVTLQADQAVETGRIRAVQHFAVSAVGETPQHSDQLTERGISPFRVLDPVLWGLYRRGFDL